MRPPFWLAATLGMLLGVCVHSSVRAQASNGPHCSPEAPCNEREGPCEQDADCSTGICSPLAGPRFGLPRDAGVCTKSLCRPFSPSAPDASACTPSCPCPEGWGDCDTNADCAGNLECRQDVGFFAGFKGLEATTYDLCVAPDWCPEYDVSVPFGNFCSTACPCASQQGDCDGDNQCQAGLVCRYDVGKWAGLDPTWDVCQPAYDPKVLDWNYCTNYGCGEGEGDCDVDSECKPGLRCAQDSGAAFGVRPDFDLCTSRYADVTVAVVTERTTGTVRMPDGSKCTGGCTYTTIRGREVAFTAEVPTSAVVSWSGCDRHSGNTCYVTADGKNTVTAYFRAKACSSPEPYCCSRDAATGACRYCAANRMACFGSIL